MDRAHFYSIMNGGGDLDYEIYLDTRRLLSCQKDFGELCNADELQFQIVHQVEELWMKLIAEALLDFDELFQKFRQDHVQLIYRSIGMDARSLKGRSVELLRKGAGTRFFPDLWNIRYKMTNAWGAEYGVCRESIG